MMVRSCVPAACLGQRVEAGLAAVTLISYDARFAATASRVVALSAQGAWGRAR